MTTFSKIFAYVVVTFISLFVLINVIYWGTIIFSGVFGLVGSFINLVLILAVISGYVKLIIYIKRKKE